MLRALTIRDVVLIDRLELSFHDRLGVLTGETGAGKSILLDALGLALGVRADSGLVRRGADRASVVAEFAVGADHPSRRILAEHGFDGDGLLLKRILGADGRSRAYLNDQPVSVALLRHIGESLVDMHGQFENQRLLDAATHRALLDAYGGHAAALAGTGQRYRAWRAAARARTEAADALAGARREEDDLRHAIHELTALDAKPGEEVALSERRRVMMHGEKLLEAMTQAAAELNGGVGAALGGALRHLARVVDKAEGRLDGAMAALERAALEAAEATSLLEKTSGEIDLDPGHLDLVEQRLFAIRAVARKHGLETDELPRLRESLAGRLAALDDEGDALGRLKRDEEAARRAFCDAAAALGEARREAAARLDAAVARELGPLKLGAATFVTRVEALDEGSWGEAGCDRVAFLIATNPGAAVGPLARIASGGEVVRLMLALKVVLARADPVPTIIFDEVDSGISGAVATAVGERLARLAEDFQVLVVTHSPQVAALGTHHWRVTKSSGDLDVLTTVDALTEQARLEEIARMLAGARITPEARAAAGRLLEGPTR